MVARYDRAMQSSRPLVVLVTGAPGSGKTTLAGRLAADLAARLVSKDALKERLADHEGQPRSVRASTRLGARAYRELFDTLQSCVAGRERIVVESNFRHGRSEAELIRALQGHPARVVHCAASSVTIERRYRSRSAARHPAHLDSQRIGDVLRDLEAGLYAPLELGHPTIEVETGSVEDRAEYRPPYASILAFVRDVAP